MEKKKVAVVLGGTNPHVSLIHNLRSRGFYTVLVDYLDNPPAKAVADEHIKKSTLDQELVLRIAVERKAQLVISTSIDQANVTACYVSEKLGLPAPYSYETARKVTNKGLMKRIMMEEGVPTSRYKVVYSLNEGLDAELDFPLVVKPVDTTGSKGVRKAETQEQLEVYLKEALELSRDGGAIVEEFNEGAEYQIDFFVQDGIAHMILVRKKIKPAGGRDIVLQSLGSILPVSLGHDVLDQIRAIGQRLADAFKLSNTSLFIQAIINESKVKVIEFACRVGGGLSYSLINKATGFDILDATVNTFVGVPSELSYRHPSQLFMTTLLYCEGGVFGSVTGSEELLSGGVIDNFYMFKTPGATIGSAMTSSDRVAAFLTVATNEEELMSKFQTAIDRLQIFDPSGRQLLSKQLYLENLPLAQIGI